MENEPPRFIDVTNVMVFVEASAPGYFTATNSAAVVITPKPVTVTARSEAFTYDGQTHGNALYDVEGLVGDDAIAAVVTGAITFLRESPVTNAVESFAFTSGSAGNYAVTTRNGELTMTKADNAWIAEPSMPGWRYGGEAGEPDLGGAAFGTATVTYRDADGTELGAERPEKPGRYEAVFTVAGTGDYGGLEKTVAFTVSQRALWPVDEPFSLDRAATYNAYLVDPATGAAAGTIRVKAGKPSRKTGASKLTVTVTLAGRKKATLRGATADGAFRARAADGTALDILLGLRSVTGTYGRYLIDGSRDFFAAKDGDSKALAAAALSRWRGTYAAAWQNGGAGGWNALSFTVKEKGKVKVTGALAGGSRVSAAVSLVVGPVGGADTRLLVGESDCAVAVNWTRRGASVSCVLWLCADGTVSCEGLPEGCDPIAARVPASPALKAGATFLIDPDGMSARMPGLLAEALPDGVPVRVKGSAFDIAKAGKVTLRKGVPDLSGAGENPAGLKLKYAAKTGLYRGFFTAYTFSGGKLRKRRVSVAGVLIDGAGYGTACLKGVGAWESGIN